MKYIPNWLKRLLGIAERDINKIVASIKKVADDLEAHIGLHTAEAAFHEAKAAEHTDAAAAAKTAAELAAAVKDNISGLLSAKK